MSDEDLTKPDREARDIPAAQLAALLEVSRTMSASLDLPVVMQTAIEAAVRVLHLETGAIYVIQGDNLLLGATTPSLPADFPEEMRWAPIASHPHVERCLRTREPVYINDTSTAELTPAEYDITIARRLKSVLYVPLVADDRPIGTFIVSSRSEIRHFEKLDIDLSTSLASTIALAVANARLYEAQRSNLTELAHAYEEVQTVREQLAALASRLTAEEDQQRRHIAAEIHDRVAQPLAIMKMKLSGGLTDHPVHLQDSSYAMTVDLLTEAISQTRSIMFDTSPPYLFDLGLRQALEWLAERTTSLGVECDCFAENETVLDEDARLFVFQAARELLTNVVKHSGATYATVSTSRDSDGFTLKVTDNGRGFDASGIDTNPAHDGGFGLFSLSERTKYHHGTLDVASAMGVGTTVSLVLPLA